MVDRETGKQILQAVTVYLQITNDAREAGYYHLLNTLSQVENPDQVGRVLREALEKVIQDISKRYPV